MRAQMHKIPDLEKLNLKDITSYGGAMQHGEERAKKHDKAASLYNHVSTLTYRGASEGQTHGPLLVPVVHCEKQTVMALACFESLCMQKFPACLSVKCTDCGLLLQIWATGDVSHADDIMAKDVHMHSLIEGALF